jgi:hypothetical protein
MGGDGGGSPGDAAGGGGRDGGGGGAGTAAPPAIILVTQLTTGATATTPSSVGFSVAAQLFASSARSCTTTPVGGCFASSCPSGGNGGPRSSLNAGTLTVTGTGASSPASLVYGPTPSPGISGYATVRGQTKFYDPGDTLSVSGGGGADVPSFAAQTLVAPADIVLTAPACGTALSGGPCPDVDRTKDAIVTWTGGGAGKVSASYITTTDNGLKSVTCFFDEGAGTGVVPAAALTMLDPASAPGFSGTVFIYPMSLTTFTVGTLPVAFEAQGSSYTGSFVTLN